MAFEFISTPKSPVANSYMSVEDADTFASGNIKGQAWLSLEESVKQALLVQATARLDLESYGGTPTTTTNTFNTPHQALQWPRLWIIDKNFVQRENTYISPSGNAYRDPEVVPRELTLATFTLAMHYLSEFNDEATVSRQDMDRLTNLSIGPLTMAIQARAEDALPDLVKRQLRSIGNGAWLGDNAGIIKLVR